MNPYKACPNRQTRSNWWVSRPLAHVLCHETLILSSQKPNWRRLQKSLWQLNPVLKESGGDIAVHRGVAIPTEA